MRECTFNECGRPMKSKGLCDSHAKQYRKNGTLKPLRGFQAPACTFQGCGKPTAAKSLCEAHRKQQLRGEELRPLRPRTPNGVPSERRCTYSGCDRSLSSAKYCETHYRQLKNSGELRPIRPRAGRYWVDSHGYLARHNSWTNSDGKRVQQKVLQHREVMETAIGRKLLPGENVHHINGIRDDNRPENLELWSRAQPPGQRVSDKVLWAVEFLATYAPEYLTNGATYVREEL